MKLVVRRDNSPLQPPQISKVHQKPALHLSRLQITLNLPLVNLCEVRHCLQLHKMCIIYHHVSDKRHIQKLALVIHRKLHLTPNRKAFCRQFLFQRLLIHRFQITGLQVIVHRKGASDNSVHIRVNI